MYGNELDCQYKFICNSLGVFREQIEKELYLWVFCHNEKYPKENI